MKYNGHFREYRLEEMAEEDLQEMYEGLYWMAVTAAHLAITSRDFLRQLRQREPTNHMSHHFWRGQVAAELAHLGRINAGRRQVKRARAKVRAHKHALGMVESQQARIDAEVAVLYDNAHLLATFEGVTLN